MCVCSMMLAKEQSSHSFELAEATRELGSLRSQLELMKDKHVMILMDKEFEWGQCELELRQTISNLRSDLAKGAISGISDKPDEANVQLLSSMLREATEVRTLTLFCYG